MDRSTTLGGNSPQSSGVGSLTNPGANVESTAKAAHQAVESTAKAAHQAVDTAADKTSEQVNRLSTSAHRAVDRAADVAGQAKEMQARVTDAACQTIRARPFATVGGALVLGYLLGRLARL